MYYREWEFIFLIPAWSSGVYGWHPATEMAYRRCMEVSDSYRCSRRELTGKDDNAADVHGGGRRLAGKRPDGNAQVPLPAPQIWKSTYSSFNATYPAVPACRDGLTALVLRDFGLDKTMPFLLGMLSATENATNLTNTEQGATRGNATRETTNLMNERYINLTSERGAHDDSRDAGSLPTDHPESGLEKGMRQRWEVLRTVLNSVRSASDNEYRESLRKQGEKGGKDLARFAKMDLRMVRNAVGDRGTFFAKMWAAFTALARLLLVNAEIAKLIAKHFLGMGWTSNSTAHSSLLSDLAGALVPAAQVRALEPLILEMFTPTFGYFFQSILGEAVGTPLSGFLSGATAAGGLQNTKMNLLDAFGRAVEFSNKHDVDSHRRLCLLSNLVMGALACQSTHFDSNDCKFEAGDNKVWMPDICERKNFTTNDVTKIRMKGYVATLQFEDLREKSPKRMLPWKSILNEDEGFNLWLLFRSVHVSLSFVDYLYPCKHNRPEEELVPGWPILHYFTYYQPGARDMAAKFRHDMPLVALARPRAGESVDTCQVLLTIRGTTNAFEWAVDIDIALVPVTTRRGVRAHRGVVHLVNTVYPSIQAVFLDLFDDAVCQDRWRIVVTGHSLGGGATNLLALRLADDFPSLDITAVSFASPIIFNKIGADLFRRLVNARTIRFDDDPVPAAPFPADKFPSGFPRCSMVMPLGEHGVLNFHSTPAVIELNLLKEVGTPDKLNMSSSIGWISMGTSDLIPTHTGGKGILHGGFKLAYDLNVPSPLQISVAHVCSYACKFSLYCDSNPETAWMCRQCSGRIQPISATVKLAP